MSSTGRTRKNSYREETPDEAMGFRRPMQVREVMVFSGNEWAMAVCPRCRLTMEREYMSYCDRCGQCLGWKDFKKASIIYPRNGKAP